MAVYNLYHLSPHLSVINSIYKFSGAPELTEAIHHMSEAYSDIGTVFDEEPKHDWEPLCHLLFEYRGLIDGFPNVISAAKVWIIDTGDPC